MRLDHILIILTLLCSSVVNAADNASSTTIRVGIYENPPLVSFKTTDEPSGLFVDIIRYIASEEGWDLHFVTGTWQENIARLDSGEIDLLPAIAVTEKRKRQYEFIEQNVLSNWGQIFVPPGSSIKAIPDLNEKRIAVLQGDIYVKSPEGIKALCEKFSLKCELLELNSYMEVLKAVDNREADAGLVNRIFGATNGSKFRAEPSSILMVPLDVRMAISRKTANHTHIREDMDWHLLNLKKDKQSIYYRSLSTTLEPPEIVEILTPWAVWLLVAIASLTVLLLVGTYLLRWQVRSRTEQLAGSERRFRRLFEGASISIWEEDYSGVFIELQRLRDSGVVNLSKYLSEQPAELEKFSRLIRVINVNPATLRMLNAKSKDDLMEGLSTVFTRSSFEVFKKGLIAAWEGHSFFTAETEHRTLSGKIIQVLISHPIPSTLEESVQLPVIVLDITDRKETEQQFSLVVDGASLGFWDWDFQTGRHNVNDHWLSMLGLSRDDINNDVSDWEKRIHPDDKVHVRPIIERHLRNHKPYVVEFRMRHKNGQWVWIQRSGSGVAYDPQTDEPIRVCGTHQDITQRKQAEADLRLTEQSLHRAQKMDAIGQLTGGIAHDFNNILGIIVGNIDFLKRLVVKDDKAIKRIETISKAALRAADLTKQLLGFSRRHAQNIVVTNINQVIQGMDSLIARSLTPEVAVEHHLINDLWPTEIDPGDFEDALLNLVLNARDAMPEGGRLMIETSNEVLDAAYAEVNSAVSPGEYVQLAVSDTGSGIAADIMDRIFEPFFTTKPQGKGTGLGLSMVFGFAERSKGHIKAYSESGAGTTFRLYLPRSDGTGREPELYLDDEERRPHGEESILVVDDEEELLELAEANLQELGYTVFTAMNGQQALDLLNENRQIDLLFSDVVMPGGMNGYELAEQAVEKQPDLKVLLTSGFTSKTVAVNGQASFSTNLLTKPYTLSRLARRVRYVLDCCSDKLN